MGCILSKMHRFSQMCLHNTTWTLQRTYFFLFSNVGHSGGGRVTGRLSSERGCMFLPRYTQPGKIHSPLNKANSPTSKQAKLVFERSAYSYGTVLLTSGEVQRFSLHFSSLRSRKNKV